MTMSKRVVLLGAKSVAKPRGLGSSFGLIGRRPFPYRQISELTKDSNLSKEHHSTLVQYETERLRRHMEKMQIELRSEIDKSTNKLARELEAARYEFFKYGTCILASVLVAGIGVLSNVRNWVI